MAVCHKIASTETYWMLRRIHGHPPAEIVPDGEKRTCVATWQSWSVSLKKAMLPDKVLISSGLIARDAAGEVDVEETAEEEGEASGLMIARPANRWAYEDAGNSSPHIMRGVPFVGSFLLFSGVGQWRMMGEEESARMKQRTQVSSAENEQSRRPLHLNGNAYGSLSASLRTGSTIAFAASCKAVVISQRQFEQV